MILELFLQGRDRDVKNLYQDVILANVPADKRDLCAQTLQAQGFWGLLSQISIWSTPTRRSDSARACTWKPESPWSSCYALGI